MKKRREQNNISVIEESNQVYRQRGITITIGSVDKGGIELRTFAIKKLGGGLRRIMDCRPLNTQLKVQHFTMNDLNNVLEIWKKND
ncbi:MAG: hypothetical protein EZS28_035520 [Streblomastix strix]|uniref:Uncharacterized protein n=1 Tax=Streblomastix strix TaxID=222440 RepID=A0A5J4UFL3_9EUKA|nr:MAG: hypothetical protein EZS28_035520 [Streblomastix strix]